MATASNESFGQPTRIFNPDAIAAGRPDPMRLVARAFAALDGIDARRREVMRRHGHHAERVARLDALEARSRSDSDDALLRLKRAIIEADPRPLVAWERDALGIRRTLGEREGCDRLMLAGPYQAIRDAIDRLGSDAVAELRRIVAEGGAA